jgi:hypothetical protein
VRTGGTPGSFVGKESLLFREKEAKSFYTARIYPGVAPWFKARPNEQNFFGSFFQERTFFPYAAIFAGASPNR